MKCFIESKSLCQQLEVAQTLDIVKGRTESKAEIFEPHIGSSPTTVLAALSAGLDGFDVIRKKSRQPESWRLAYRCEPGGLTVQQAPKVP
jgi:hypothetical protein